jgi:hypothetical protein
LFPGYKYGGTLPPPTIDSDTLPSSEADESSNFYYRDGQVGQVRHVGHYEEEGHDTDGHNEGEETDMQSDCERIFIKQNNQFVGVKPHEVTVHARSHLASPERCSRKSSRELSEAECDRELKSASNLPPKYLHEQKSRRSKK